jgi:CubicO group peptidase (beta-lactamase class C family)
MSRFPPPGDWPEIAPRAAGFDPDLLAEAVAYAETAETPWPISLEGGLSSDPRTREPPPWNEVLGPTRPRGRPNGLVVRGGRVVARWGDTRRVDMTFSVAKSYLALLAGVAMTRGLIRDLDDPARAYALDDGFESPQNRDITWRHLLQQTSEWEGTLFDKPDLVDRNREVGVDADNSRKGTHRDLGPPGSHWEYNDVRVNRLSLSLLQAFRQPLPEVLAESIMEPIGASDTWEWLPYRNAWVTVEGRSMPSVPGGAHWGGGIFIHSEDHARVAQLVLARGTWQDRALIADHWFERLAEPCPLKPDYGLLWWLNTGGQHYPSAPSDSLFAIGAGQHLLWIAPGLDLVVVARWIEDAKVDGLLGRIVAAL